MTVLPYETFLRGYEAVKYLAGYRPNPPQELFHCHPARHRVVVYGRQTGKTHGAAIEALAGAFGTDERPHPIWWLVAPTYAGVQELWEHIRQWCATTDLRLVVESLLNNPMELRLRNAGVLRAKSADDPDLLRGAALDGVVIEEAAQIPDYTFQNVLLPMFTVTRGRLLAISTPRGRNNWFYRWWLLGQGEEHPDIKSFHATSYDNPQADREYLQLMKDTIVSSAFEQEFMAEFIEDAEQVFRRIDDSVGGKLSDPVPGKPYVIGVDWAKVHDFTVFCVGDVYARALVAYERFHRQDYNLQVSRLKDLATKYNHASILMDSTPGSSGDPVLEMCQNEGLRLAQGYPFTWSSKKHLIDALAIAIERAELRIPDIPQLRRELESYRQVASERGNVKYGALMGEGYYDDFVTALALMWWQMAHGAYTSQTTIRSRFDDESGETRTRVGSRFG